MKIPLLICLGWSSVAKAQGAGELYAAPGMAVRLPGRVQLVTPHHERRVAAKLPPIPAIFPRFWQQPDSAKRSVAQLFFRRINGNTKYPATTLRAQVEGTIFIRLIILPTGEVSEAKIVDRKLSEQLADADNKESLNQAKTDLNAAALKSV